MQFTSSQKTALAWMAIALGIGVLMWLLGPVLTPFVVAAVLAYALNPVVDRLQRSGGKRLPRALSVALVELLFIMVVLTVLLLIVPVMAKEIPLMRDQLPVLADKLNAWLAPLLKSWGLHVSLNVDSIKGFAIKYLSANFEDGVASVLSSIKLGGSVALAIIGNAILIPVVLFYLLMDWDSFVLRAKEFIPRSQLKDAESFADEADTVLGQYLRGQLLVMVIMAVFYSTGLALFGLDLALPIGVFTGLAMIVPYLGFGLGLILAVLAGILQFASIKVLVMVAAVYGLGQLLEGFFLTPRLVGERIGLHPLAVIFALLAFGQLFGLVGVLVALPVSAVLLVGMRRLRIRYLASALYKQ